MNTTEAEMLLHCHREGREPDSRIQKALRVAESDSELGRRLREQMEFDEQITEAIHYILPPEDLRTKLGALSEAAGNGKKGWRGQMSSPGVLAAIMGVLMLVGVIVFLVMESMAHFAGRENVEKMLDSAGKISGTEFDPVAMPVSQMGDWFYMRHYEGYETPAELATQPVAGARVFWQDKRPIAQFIIEQPALLIFQFHASDFNVQLPANGEWRIIEQKEWAGAIRQRDGNCVMIAVRGGEPEVRQALNSLPKK